jgi:hypothetical protein
MKISRQRFVVPVLTISFSLLLLHISYAEPVVEIYGEGMDKATIDQWVKLQKPAQNTISLPYKIKQSLRETANDETKSNQYDPRYWIVLSHLQLHIFKHEVKERQIPVDQKYVEGKIAENQVNMPEEEFQRLKHGKRLTYIIVSKYRLSGMDITSFIQNRLVEFEEQLKEAGIPLSMMRDHIKFYSHDEAFYNLRQEVRHFPETREEFLSQVNNPDLNMTFYELMSQIEQLKKRIAGTVTLTEDELKRGTEYYESKGKDYFQQSGDRLQGYISLNSDDVQGFLIEIKTEYLIDAFVVDKIKKDAIFLDEAYEKDFMEWLDKYYPRHKEAFSK